eukprot:13338.XXX_214141_214308_1 [CDS] Oithona nana genome sequencing.
MIKHTPKMSCSLFAFLTCMAGVSSGSVFKKTNSLDLTVMINDYEFRLLLTLDSLPC